MSSNKTDTWYPMYPGDYLKKTLDLTLEEDGFYTRALNQVYINKGRIPAEPERLQRLLRVNRVQFNRCKWILSKYFFQDGDSYGNRRADEEIATAQRNHEIASESGRRGNAIRWGKASPPDSGPDKKSIGSQSPPVSEPVSPNGRSSSSPLNPPLIPPSGAEEKPPFQKALPHLCKLFGIENPSHRDENELFQTWVDLKAKKATTAEVRRRIARYREIWPEMPVTQNAILKHWHTCKPIEKPVPVPGDDAIPDSLLEDGDD
jgi:uncharacterized protein YdaU (DUF1376 family)